MAGVMIDKQKLQSLLDDFYSLTKIRVTFWGNDGERCLSGCTNCCSEYCQALQSASGVLLQCKYSEDQALHHASKNPGVLHCFQCHAGMNEFIYPVTYEGMLLGYFMFGQARLSEIPDDANARRDLYARLGLNAEVMDIKYHLLPVFSYSYMETAGRMLAALASYAHLKGLMKLKNMTLSENIREYIRLHFKENITPKQICDFFHISQSTFCHVLKRQQHKTFVEMLHHYRIQYVKELLETGSTVAAASFLAGFSSENYMARIFHKVEGISPSAYRDRLSARSVMAEDSERAAF